MLESVIADNVSGFGDFAGDVGTLLHVASDEKKSCKHVMLGQDFQQSHRVRIVGAVVIGKSKLLVGGREAGECASVPLAGGSHRLVPSGDGRCGRSGSNEQGCE